MTFSIDFRIRRADGVYRWFQTRAVAIRDQSDKILKWFGVNTDVEDLIQADQHVRTLNTALERRVEERTAQMEATNKELEAFSYSVCHDLRAPLRSIDGFSRILLEDFADKLGEDGRSNLQRVRGASQRIGQLIDDLLQLSRVTRSTFYLAPVDLSALASAVATELITRESDRCVDFIIQPGIVAPKADARLLRIVIENLLGNAWKFTSNEPAAKIEFGASEREGSAVYSVHDNGAGFDMAYVHKLFGAFQRLHRVEEYEGTGIGLTIVQRIVHRHGGRVWAEGEPGKGATFCRSLFSHHPSKSGISSIVTTRVHTAHPQTAGLRAVHRSIALVRHEPRHTEKYNMKPLLRVLNVEDSEDDTRLLLRELARSDYEIVHKRVETAEALTCRTGSGKLGHPFLRFHLAGI